MRSSKLQEVAIVFYVGGNEEYILYCCNGKQTITNNAYKIFWQWVAFVMEWSEWSQNNNRMQMTAPSKFEWIPMRKMLIH